MVTCELCGKQVKTAQALRGHKTFIHGVAGSNTQQPVTRPANDQLVSKLEDRLSKLEYITGLREADLDDLLSDTELPLTNKLTNITEQLSKLSDTVSKLSQDVRLVEVTRGVEREEFSKRLTDLREAHNRQSAVINEHRDTFNDLPPENRTTLNARLL